MTVGVSGNGGTSEVINHIFHTHRSRRAASLFLRWFLANGGKASKNEMSSFAYELGSGVLGFKFARRTFYGFVLRRFLDEGLIALEPSIDQRTRKVLRMYRRVIQPIQKRRPSGPSLIYNAHILAEEWNGLFKV